MDSTRAQIERAREIGRGLDRVNNVSEAGAVAVLPVPHAQATTMLLSASLWPPIAGGLGPKQSRSLADMSEGAALLAYCDPTAVVVLHRQDCLATEKRGLGHPLVVINVSGESTVAL